MDPLTWAIIGASTAAVAAGAGTGLSIVGSVLQHQQAKANAEAQSDALNANARREELEAKRIEAESAESARRQREQSEHLQAQQRALLGKSGAAMSSGSPLAVLGATAADQEIQIQDTHREGYNAAAQHLDQANIYRYQAGVARASAPSGLSLGLNIAGQAVSGIGNAVTAGLAFKNYQNQYGSKGTGSSASTGWGFQGSSTALKNFKL